MGRLRILLVAFAGVAGVGVVLSPGCRDATQVTLELGLSPRAQCNEILGTAITVGIEPRETEARVVSGFVTAATSKCDGASRAIGTLVVTPSDSGSASVIVIVGYGVTPDKCRPPLYDGCIVARRHFAFAEHRKLRMPITIDPDCKNVPCDAFSTCRTGKCFSAETSCDGDTCPEPGALPDGGTDPDAAVTPEGGTDGAIVDGSITEGGDAADSGDSGDSGDGNGGDGGTVVAYCDGADLHCQGQGQGVVPCGTLMNKCCDTASVVAACNSALSCQSLRYCCSDTDCDPATAGTCTGASGTEPGKCTAATSGANVSCPGGQLQCPSPKGGVAGSCTPGTTVACCEEADGLPYCSNVAPCPVNPPSIRWCCVKEDCAADEVCGGKAPPPPGTPARCTKLMVVDNPPPNP